MKTSFRILCAAGLLFTLLAAACSPRTAEPRSKLVVFAAGSLITPFHQLEEAFEAKYPNIDVQIEYHGSIQVMRHVTDLHEKIDVVATADVSLIPMLMYSANDEESGKPYADWYIHFATNRLALAYTPQSKYAAEINADNWYEILSRHDVRTGISDPRFDAAGYRALMAFALAIPYYGENLIFANMFAGRMDPPLSLFREDDLATITVPEIVNAVPNSGIVIRGASVELLALLESGELDYAFEYESVIRQHKLEMVVLPDAINLGVEDEDYSGVEVKLDFQRFARVKPIFRGEQIGYGVTIPGNAEHPQEAELFIAFLLGPEGRAIMAANNQPLFEQPLADNYAAVPEALRGLCAPR